MKKMLSVLLALAMVFSLSCTAFAVEEVEYEPSTEEAIITPRSSLSLSFVALQTNSKELSSETYYISNEDAMLTINSCTWNPSSQDVKIGWYNVDNKITYTVTYGGGDISSKKINSSGVPDGDYKVCIINAGSKSITGALQYEVK